MSPTALATSWPAVAMQVARSDRWRIRGYCEHQELRLRPRRLFRAGQTERGDLGSIEQVDLTVGRAFAAAVSLAGTQRRRRHAPPVRIAQAYIDLDLARPFRPRLDLQPEHAGRRLDGDVQAVRVPIDVRRGDLEELGPILGRRQDAD